MLQFVNACEEAGDLQPSDCIADILHLTGSSGSGRTRFATELLDNMRAHIHATSLQLGPDATDHPAFKVCISVNSGMMLVSCVVNQQSFK